MRARSSALPMCSLVRMGRGWWAGGLALVQSGCKSMARARRTDCSGVVASMCSRHCHSRQQPRAVHSKVSRQGPATQRCSGCGAHASAWMALLHACLKRQWGRVPVVKVRTCCSKMAASGSKHSRTAATSQKGQPTQTCERMSQQPSLRVLPGVSHGWELR